jgi:hypothetical protein
LGRRDSSRVLAKVLDIYGLEFFKITSHYHKSGDFQDNTANREFFGLTEDWAFRSWGISAVRFSGYYGIIVNLAKFAIGGTQCRTQPRRLAVDWSVLLDIKTKE